MFKVLWNIQDSFIKDFVASYSYIFHSEPELIRYGLIRSWKGICQGFSEILNIVNSW